METITKTKQRSALRLLAALFFLCLFAPMAAGQDNWKGHCANKIENKNGGQGTSWDNAIKIATAEELAYFAQQVNAGEDLTVEKNLPEGSGTTLTNNSSGDSGFDGIYFALAADINLSAHYWTPIGNNDHSFCGNFDGKGHCVKGLRVKVETAVSQEAYAGLFGYADSGTLRNLGVVLASEGVQAVPSTIANAYAGGIAGKAYKICNCYVVGEGEVVATGKSSGNPGTSTGEVNALSHAGGIVGYLSSSLIHCYATVGVKAKGDFNNNAGGIAGSCSRATLSYTYATGAVEAAGGDKYNYAGGICGHWDGTLSNNLALNEQVNGGDGESNRIAGGVNSSTTTRSANYASPEIQVNGKTISSGAVDNVNGNADITLKNFETTLKGDGSNEWNNAWTFPAGGLPQLKLNDSSTDTPNYSDWPDPSPQQPIPASDHLIAGSIANTNGGDGSSWDAPILIADRVELAYLAKQVNAGKDLTVESGLFGGSNTTLTNNSGFDGIYFALAADIDLSAYYWTPIGDSDHPFRGNFDGKGHCVKGLRVKVETAVSKDAYAGLFGSSLGTLRNLGVVLAPEGVQAVPSTLASAYAGGIAGKADNISNCYVVGEGEVVAIGKSGTSAGGEMMHALSHAGGIVGYLLSSLTHCYATVGVEAKGGDNNHAGGIAGDCPVGNVTLSYTYATGAVKAVNVTGNNYAGGICGSFPIGTLSNNLALNKQITGKEGQSNRIAGGVGPSSYTTLFANYASTKNKAVSNGNDKDMNGADTWFETFKGNLIPDPAAADNGWSKAWSWSGSGSSNLPQLKIVQGDAGGSLSYTDWPSSSCQPTLPASNYLENKPVPPPVPDPEPEPTPPVYYTVTLPSVTGAATDPVAGDYEVESWSTFRFYLTLDTAYSESAPVITTDRGETLTPRSSDGAYQVKYVRTDVSVFIDGIVENNPVANETIRAATPEPEIWSENACLCIRLPEGMPSSPVRIFTPEGRLLDSFRSVPGLNRRQLPTDIYIVQVGATVRKVIIR